MATKKAEYKRLPEVRRTYRHYKGGLYKVISLANHSETGEALVVYKSVGFGTVYVRPLSMWFDEVVNHRDEKVERFEHEF